MSKEIELIDDLKKASEQIALAGHDGWGNLCNDAQAALAAKDAEILKAEQENAALRLQVHNNDLRMKSLQSMVMALEAEAAKETKL